MSKKEIKRQKIINDYLREQKLWDETLPSIKRDTGQYIDLLRFIDRQQSNAYVEIVGLPYHSYQITNALYEHGILGFVMNDIQQLEIVQVVPTSWQPNGQINTFTCIQPFSNPFLSTQQTFINHVNGVLLYDTIGPARVHPSRRRLTETIIDDMSRIFSKLQTNILISGDKIAIKGVPMEQQEEMRAKLLQDFDPSNPFMLFDTFLGMNIELMTPNFEFMQLWNALKHYDQFRQSMHGYATSQYGNDKSNYTNEEETEGDATQAKMLNEFRKSLWEQWATEMELIHKITVKLVFCQERYMEGNGNDTMGNSNITT